MEEKLKQQLPEALKIPFEEFIQAWNDVLFTAEGAAFVNGYQFGVQMIVAGMIEPLAD